MMRELRRLKLFMDRLDIIIQTELLPSVMNCNADALSRRFGRGDLHVLSSLWRSIADGMKVPLGVFPFLPPFEHPSFLR